MNENKEKVKDKENEEEGSQLWGQRSMKNDENGAAMKKGDGSDEEGRWLS